MTTSTRMQPDVVPAEAGMTTGTSMPPDVVPAEAGMTTGTSMQPDVVSKVNDKGGTPKGTTPMRGASGGHPPCRVGKRIDAVKIRKRNWRCENQLDFGGLSPPVTWRATVRTNLWAGWDSRRQRKLPAEYSLAQRVPDTT